MVQDVWRVGKYETSVNVKTKALIGENCNGDNQLVADMVERHREMQRTLKRKIWSQCRQFVLTKRLSIAN